VLTGRGYAPQLSPCFFEIIEMWNADGQLRTLMEVLEGRLNKKEMYDSMGATTIKAVPGYTTTLGGLHYAYVMVAT
jgi:hypothetical protein